MNLIALMPYFLFTLEACCDPDGVNRHGSQPFYSEKYSVLVS
jgi:hypothetical protein